MTYLDIPILTQVLTDAWRLILAGATDRKSAFHLPTIATVASDGAPSLRTVVLREVDAERRILRFHTDNRSPKVQELSAEPRFALHVYDPSIQTQLRFAGCSRIHHLDDTARAAWEESAPMSRLCYAATEATGATVSAPPPAPIQNDGSEDSGFENFCAVVLTVERLEWLYLLARGHQRAVFQWDASGACRAEWIAP